MVALLAVLLFLRLGFWQLERREQRVSRNAAIAAAAELPVLELDSGTVRAIHQNPARFVNQRVRVRGTYDPAGEVVLRGRAQGGRPGVHLVTPLQIGTGGSTVLVNRGWVPSPDALSVDAEAAAEPGVRQVEGVLLAVPSGVEEALVQGTARRLNLQSIRRTSGASVLPLYVQQLGPPANPPMERIPQPALDEGPHLSYAVQWFCFALVTLVGFLIVIRRRAG